MQLHGSQGLSPVKNLAAIADRQFRQPDEGVFMLGPITLPMLLSLAMVAIGAFVIAACRGRPPIGGLSLAEGAFADPANTRPA